MHHRSSKSSHDVITCNFVANARVEMSCVQVLWMLNQLMARTCCVCSVGVEAQIGMQRYGSTEAESMQKNALWVGRLENTFWVGGAPAVSNRACTYKL